MAEVLQQRSAGPALGGRQPGATCTWEELHATALRAEARRAGLSNLKGTPAAGLHNATPPPPLDQLSKQSRRHSRQARPARSGSKGCSSGGDGKSQSSSPAEASSTSVWVWGQEPPTKASATPTAGRKKKKKQEQQQQQQQQQETNKAVTVGGVTAGDEDGDKKAASVDERKKMFADVESSSSCSTVGTVELTASESGSNKANSPTCVAAVDESFWNKLSNELSEFSVQFPEPPTRVPTPAPSNSTALAISGWGKNITSTLPSVQVLLPPRWRKRLRTAGTHKRSRKSTTRWVARSKATSSMSESCVFARAVSISDGTSHHHHRQRREKEMGVTAVPVSHDSAPAAVAHEPAAAPVATPVAEAAAAAAASAAEEKPSEVVAEVSEKSAPVLVEIAEEEEQPQPQPQQQADQRQQLEPQPQQQADQQQQLERQQQQLEKQLRQLEQQLQQLEQPQRQQQQQQQQQEQQEQQQKEHRAVPSSLPTPVAVQAAPSTPPPAPLWTAPRPPLSSRQQTPAATRYPLRRTARYFGSASSMGSARDNRRSPSSYMTTTRVTMTMTMKNRLASSGSSIFEEDGDDSKKTKWLNPFTLSPAAPGAAPAAGTAAAPARAPAPAPAPAPRACVTPRAPNAGKGAAAAPSPSSPAWVWGAGSPRRSNANAAASHHHYDHHQQRHEQQQQQQPSVFVTGAGWGRRKRNAAVRALAIEINRRDAMIYGDQRRRVRNGESGIWLPSPGIWSSGRVPTPLNSDMFHAW